MKTLFLYLIFFYCSLLSAQIYEFSVSTGTYENLENSISVNNGKGWDGERYTIPIGFDFEFYGDIIDTLYATGGDGVLFDFPNLNQTDFFFSGIMPLFGSLTDIRDGEESLSKVSYLVGGEEGSRILKIEWNNIGFFANVTNGNGLDFANFQLWLYESNGSIAFHYGDSFVEDIPLIFDIRRPKVGLFGNFNTGPDEFDEFLILDGDPASPAPHYFLSGFEYQYKFEFNLDSMPPSGTIYTFNQAPVSTQAISDLSKQFEVTPNPALKVLSLKTSIDVNKIKSVSVYNINGALMNVVNSDYNQIQIGHLNSGLYHLNVLTDEGLASKRFVKLE